MKKISVFAVFLMVMFSSVALKAEVNEKSLSVTPFAGGYFFEGNELQKSNYTVVFATPAFCQSRVCGPTLDSVKAIARTESGIDFINVEPYKMTFTDGHLQPVLDASGYLQATDVTNAWGLPTEPWIFVVDRNGIVRGSWSTVVSTAELTAAIDAVK